MYYILTTNKCVTISSDIILNNVPYPFRDNPSKVYLRSSLFILSKMDEA